ncbi:MAG: PIN domain-containing protein [Candidatus Omnitrophota bacterium]
MENVFVDTSGWVALFVRNDINNEKSVRLYNEIKRGKIQIYTSDYVVDETITTIMVRGSHRESVLAGTAILESKIVKIVNVFPDYFQRAWECYQKYRDKQFSFTDVSCFCIMEDIGIDMAFSFDKGFRQAGINIM